MTTKVYLDLDVLNFASRIPKVPMNEEWKFEKAEGIINLARKGDIEILISWIAVETSLEKASSDIRELCFTSFEELLRDISKVKEPKYEDLHQLASEYIRRKAIIKDENAIHVGAATLIGADYLLTWDEKHILRKECKRM